MGSIHVHEFMSLDGVIDTPTWTFDFGFDPRHGRGDRRGHGPQPRHPARADDVRDVRARGPYDPDAIRALKDRIEGDLYVSGSGTLVRALLGDGLVDELHLFVYPLTRGSGPRLFPDAPACTLTLAASRSRRRSRTTTASSTSPTGRSAVCCGRRGEGAESRRLPR